MSKNQSQRPKFNCRIKPCENCKAKFKRRHNRTCLWAFKLRPGSKMAPKNITPKPEFPTDLVFSPKEKVRMFLKQKNGITFPNPTKYPIELKFNIYKVKMKQWWNPFSKIQVLLNVRVGYSDGDWNYIGTNMKDALMLPKLILTEGEDSFIDLKPKFKIWNPQNK